MKLTKQKNASAWCLTFEDGMNIRRRLVLLPDKRASELIQQTIERLKSAKVKGLDDETLRLMNALPARIYARLNAWGMIDRQGAGAGKPLSEHLQDYAADLKAQARTAFYIKVSCQRIQAILDDCHAVFFADIQASSIRAAIDRQRKSVLIVDADGNRKQKDLGAISQNTKAAYLTAIKAFFAWAVGDGRLAKNPFQKTKGGEKKTKGQAAQRQALDAEAVSRLLQHTAAAGTRYGMTGHERCPLYRLAIESGLRSNELRSLTAANFDFQAGMVTLAGGYCKNREAANLPLKADTAAMLKEYLANKIAQARAFNMPHPCSVVRMLRKDLRGAGINAADYDFHCLRHSFSTMLIQSGVDVKTAQSLMRHSTPTLTLGLYTHIVRGAEKNAVESLPTWQIQAAQATGTDGDCIGGQKKLPKNCQKTAKHGQKPCATMSNDAKLGISQNAVKTPLDYNKTHIPLMGRAGVEPATHGFSVHCSTN